MKRFLPQPLDHQDAFSLLPWLANGTLEGADLEGVLDHLKVCRECREELRFLPELRCALEQNAPLPSPGRSFARLLARIEREERAGQPWRERLRAAAERWLGDVPPWLRGTLAVQSVALAVLAAMLLWPRPAPAPALFRTLSTPVETSVPAGARMRLVLAEGTPVEQMRAVLQGIEAQIVGGPSGVGAFTIELAPGVALEPALAGLRAAPAVLLAEPLLDAASEGG